MGFDPVSLGVIALAGSQLTGGVVNSYNQRKAAKSIARASASNQEAYENKAKVLNEEALQNSIKMRKNANRAMGQVRADAGGSNLAVDGSVALREMDEASRLEAEIIEQTRQSLQRIDDLKDQARLDALNAQSQARSHQAASTSSLLSGFGNAGRTLSNW